MTTIPPPDPIRPPWSEAPGEVPGKELEIATFGRHLDRSVHRWSFSAITAGVDAAWMDPFDASGADRGATDESDPGPIDDQDGVPAAVPGDGAGPLAGLRAGTEFGTFVHGVLERVDFASADLDTDLGVAAREQVARSGFDLDTLVRDGSEGLPRLVEGLRAAIETPLGPLFGATRLADLARSDRLDELGFDMRLGGAGRRPTVRDIGRVTAGYLPVDHVLGPWARALAAGAIDVQLAGYLTGSIDLVARVGTANEGRGFVVADYKTNQLAPRGEVTGPSAYDRAHMADAMVGHHYPLQALLYGVALHRYLRSRRRPGSPPGAVLGAAYLFVRGMTGRGVAHDGAHPHGVFTWEFDPAMLDSLSDLLHGREV